MKALRRSGLRRFVVLAASVGAVTLGSLATLAAPGIKTLAELARAEGWDPDFGDPRPNLAKEIPRDFPVPSGSHNLHASNAFPFASVSGTPAETEEFYRAVFPIQGWHIRKEVKFKGFISFIACKGGECAGVSSASAEVDAANANLIQLHFFPDKAKSP
jgi:hypothetical protein